MSKREKKKRSETPRMRYRAIPFQQIPRHLQPLVLKTAKFEKALMTTKNTVDMCFDHLLDVLTELKTESMNLIQQAGMLEKEKKEEKKG